MSNLISEAVRRQCAAYDVHIDARVTMDFRDPMEIAIETPVEIRPGLIDADLIGAFSYLGGDNSFIRHVNFIGRFSQIAANVQIGLPEHPMDFVSCHPLFYGRFGWQQAQDFRSRNPATFQKAVLQHQAKVEDRFPKIVIGNDVWIGEGAFIRRGVEIGDGAIIASRSVVTKDVPPYAIVAGTPARIIRYRFPQDVIDELLRLQWWLYGFSALDGADVTDIDMALWRISENITTGRAQLYRAPILSVSPDRVTVYDYDPETGELAA